MLPEVFECPDCQRQFVLDLVAEATDCSVICPQCRRYLGEKDLHYILRSEIEELARRLRFELDRLERDEAIYGMSETAAEDAELRAYGREVHKVLAILRRSIRELEALEVAYRP